MLIKRGRKDVIQRDRILEIVLKAIDDTDECLAGHSRIEKSPDAILFGRGGSLDSLGLLNFIIAVEEHVAAELGKNITIVDERAMSQTHSPFLTIETFVQYLLMRLEEKEK